MSMQPSLLSQTCSILHLHICRQPNPKNPNVQLYWQLFPQVPMQAKSIVKTQPIIWATYRKNPRIFFSGTIVIARVNCTFMWRFKYRKLYLHKYPRYSCNLDNILFVPFDCKIFKCFIIHHFLEYIAEIYLNLAYDKKPECDLSFINILISKIIDKCIHLFLTE